MESLVTRRRFRGRSPGLLVAAWAALALAACNDPHDSRTAGQKLDSAIARTETTMEQVKDKAQLAGQEAREAASNLGGRIERSTSDARITAGVKAALIKDPELSALKVEVDTNGGRVSLAGAAPTLAAKERATALAKAVEGVLSVDNRLVVRTPAAVAPRG